MCWLRMGPALSTRGGVAEVRGVDVHEVVVRPVLAVGGHAGVVEHRRMRHIEACQRFEPGLHRLRAEDAVKFCNELVLVVLAAPG